MTRQIRTIGFCNSLYMGKVKQCRGQSNGPQGIGILFNDMGITCLSNWNSMESGIRGSGPSVLLLQNKEIYYGEEFPVNSNFQGFWCCVFPQLRIYGNGERKVYAVVDMSVNKIICKIMSKQNQQYLMGSQSEYETEQQKWQIIRQIINHEVVQEERSLKNFIKVKFSDMINHGQDNPFISVEVQEDQWLYGIVNNNQAIGFSIKQRDDNETVIKSTGFYGNIDKPGKLTFGRMYIEQAKKSKIYEGNFRVECQQQLYKFGIDEERPIESYRTSRNYFRQSTNYCNKYIHLNDIAEIQKKLLRLKNWYMQKIAARFSQKILEGRNEKKSDGNEQIAKDGQEIVNEYNLQDAKIILEKQIKYKNNERGYRNQQIFRSVQKKVKRYGYSDFDDETQYYKSMKRKAARTDRNKVQEFRLYEQVELQEMEKQHRLLVEMELEKEMEIKKQIQLQALEVEKIRLRALEREREVQNELRGKIQRELDKQKQLQTQRRYQIQKMLMLDRRQCINGTNTMREFSPTDYKGMNKTSQGTYMKNTKNTQLGQVYRYVEQQFPIVTPNKISAVDRFVKDAYQPKEKIMYRGQFDVPGQSMRKGVPRRIFSYTEE